MLSFVHLHPLASQLEPQSARQHSSDRPSGCPGNVALNAASAAVVAPVGPNMPAAHVVPVHDVGKLYGCSLSQPAPLCRPAGQSAQVLMQEEQLRYPPQP